ncbi:hypothetical protein GCM10007887_02860 [Methylobacterium haplocladii]|uniref:Uncharacterized protein n=1 Tax=Methylobacterium haplocladii TaxID=1176176 RepID=A0A512ILX5_9HYPH|nr:hypothetical protein MHA02_11080 [Methylobacterium haplocladii]GLS57630.1 hypothetical protein GCM10007887_02860 [Methylobacterium haplocladii]
MVETRESDAEKRSMLRPGGRPSENHVPTEAEFEANPDAAGGRALLEARLRRLTPAQVEAFREAVRRCYAGAPPPEPSGPDRTERR